MPISPVSITNDLAMPVMPFGMTFHDVTLPSGTPIPFAPCIEPPVQMMWPPGFALFQNKLTTTVLHKAMPVVLDGHNCGYMLPHVSIPASNLLTPMQIAFSSRKVAFSASKVKANGTPVACVFPSFLMPMTCCAQPVTMPNGIALLNVVNTVIIGMSWGDFVLGWVLIRVGAILDAAFYKFPKPLPYMQFAEKMLLDALWKLALGDKPGKWLAKTAVGLVVGAAKIIFTGEGSVSVSLGSNYAGASFSYSQTSDGDKSAAATGNIFGHQGSKKTTWKADGTKTTTKTSKNSDTNNRLEADSVSQTTSTSTTTYDQNGNAKSQSESTTITETEDNPWSGSSKIHQQKTTTNPGGAPKQSSSDYTDASSWGKPL